MKYSNILLLLFVLVIINVVFSLNTITVSPTTTFKDLKSALNSAIPLGINNVVVDTSAAYTGELNNGLVIEKTKFKMMPKDSSNIIIDCKNVGNGFTILDVKYFYLNRIEFRNCVGSKGGALYINNSIGIIESSQFSGSNSYFGDSIYISNSEVTFKDIMFNDSKGSSDIYLENSNIQFNNVNTQSQYLSYCSNSILAIDSLSNIENKTHCAYGCEILGTRPFCTKNALLNSSKVYFSGMLFSYPSNDIPVSSFDSDYLNALPNDIEGLLTGYLYLNKPLHLDFGIISTNVKYSIFVKGNNNPVLISASSHEDKRIVSKPIYFEEGIRHEILVHISSSSSHARQFKILPFSNHSDIKIFYSKNICLDGGYDGPFDCPSDQNFTSNQVSCKSEDKNNNFQTCFKELSKSCSPRSVSKGHISAGFSFEEDTLGDLISNQMLWTLPGSEHFTFGMNIITGENAPSPVFQYDYCQKTETIIEDPYRGFAYKVPPQLNAKSFPQCTFSTDSSFYSSSSELQAGMSNDASVGASVEGGYDGISGSVAFSGEKSVSKSQSVSTTSTQTVIKTDINCYTSYVEMDDSNIQFHPNFLSAIKNIKHETDMLKVIEKFGTYYYKKSYLGGKLTQITTTSESSSSGSSQSEQSASASASISASVKEGSFNGGASVSGNYASKQESEAQAQTSSKMSFSEIISYGGAPENLASDYFRWSSTVDVYPVPLNYTLAPIRDIIHSNWTITIGSQAVKVLNLWKQYEEVFYNINGKSYDIDNDDDAALYHYSLFTFFPFLNATDDLPKYMTLSSTDSANRTSVLHIPLKFVHVTPDGQEYDMHLYANYPLDCTKSTTFSNDVYNPTQLGIIYSKLPKKCAGHAATRQSPFRYEFTSKIDILSLTNLVYKTNLNIDPNKKSYIIQWESGKGIVLDHSQNKIVSSSTYNDRVFFISAFEKEYSDRLDDITESNLLAGTVTFSGNEGAAKYKGLYDDLKDWLSYIIHTSGTNAQLIEPLASSNYFYYNYRNFEMPKQSRDVDEIRMFTHSYYGSKTRLNYLLVFVKNLDNPIAFDVLSYNINTDYSTIFTELSNGFKIVNVTENGDPSDYHTYNFNKPLVNSYNDINNPYNVNSPEEKTNFVRS